MMLEAMVPEMTEQKFHGIESGTVWWRNLHLNIAAGRCDALPGKLALMAHQSVQ